jgi:hypothetical protein
MDIGMVNISIILGSTTTESGDSTIRFMPTSRQDTVIAEEITQAAIATGITTSRAVRIGARRAHSPHSMDLRSVTSTRRISQMLRSLAG